MGKRLLSSLILSTALVAGTAQAADKTVIHVMHQGDEPLLADIRKLWRQPLILNRPGRPRDEIGADLAAGLADLEAYGQMVLANPDFVERLRDATPLNEADRASYFGGGAQGYVNYPARNGATAN